MTARRMLCLSSFSWAPWALQLEGLAMGTAAGNPEDFGSDRLTASTRSGGPQRYTSRRATSGTRRPRRAGVKYSACRPPADQVIDLGLGAAPLSRPARSGTPAPLGRSPGRAASCPPACCGRDSNSARNGVIPMPAPTSRTLCGERRRLVRREALEDHLRTGTKPGEARRGRPGSLPLSAASGRWVRPRG